MRTLTTLTATALLVAILPSLWAQDKPPAGFPAADEVRRAYDDADLNRAIQAYKFFYPTVAFSTGYANLRALGILENQHVAMLSGSPKQLIFTANADTPYAFAPLDLRSGPVVIELPPGPIMGAINDLNQQ